MVNMNGFLVLLCHTMDDLPVALRGTRDKAMALVNDLGPMPSEYIRKVFGTDCSTPSCIKIVEFHNGVPVKCEVVREFDD